MDKEFSFGNCGMALLEDFQIFILTIKIKIYAVNLVRLIKYNMRVRIKQK